jgi:hypothetical protein
MWHYIHRTLNALKFILDNDMVDIFFLKGFISILNEMEMKLEDTFIVLKILKV